MVDRVAPVSVNASGFINNYTALAWSSAMYIAHCNGVNCREIRMYDHHPVSYARNMAVKEFMEDESCTHLLFMDSDNVPPIDVIPKLLRHNKLVVSGWYNARSGSGLPVVFKRSKHGWSNFTYEELLSNAQPDGLTMVDGVGAGILMIKRETFEVLNTLEPFLEHYSIKQGSRYQGEDLYFGNLLKDHGIPIYVDATVRALHWGWILR